MKRIITEKSDFGYETHNDINSFESHELERHNVEIVRELPVEINTFEWIKGSTFDEIEF